MLATVRVLENDGGKTGRTALVGYHYILNARAGWISWAREKPRGARPAEAANFAALLCTYARVMTWVAMESVQSAHTEKQFCVAYTPRIRILNLAHAYHPSGGDTHTRGHTATSQLRASSDPLRELPRTPAELQPRQWASSAAAWARGSGCVPEGLTQSCVGPASAPSCRSQPRFHRSAQVDEGMLEEPLAGHLAYEKEATPNLLDVCTNHATSLRRNRQYMQGQFIRSG